MRKLINLLPILLFLAVGCTKDNVAIIESFEFSIEESYNEEITINFPEKTIVSIIPKKMVTSNRYSYKYEVLIGKGKYMDQSNKEIRENVFHPLSGLTLEISYLSNTIQKEKVRLTIVDSYGKEKKIELEYNVNHNEYEVELTSSIESASINRSIPFSVELINNGKDQAIDFEREFFIDTGEGIIFDSNGNELEQGKFISIMPGKTDYSIIFREPGPSEITLNLKDSNNQPIQKALSFEITPIEFEFKASTNRPNALNNETVPIVFELTKQTDGTETYIVNYESDGNGKLVYGDIERLPRIPFEIQLSDSSSGLWEAEYTGTSAGSQSLDFSISTEGSQSKSDQVSINFEDTTPQLLHAEFEYRVESVDIESRIDNTNYGKRYMKLSVKDFDYNSPLEVTKYDINGIEYNIGEEIQIGYISFEESSTRNSCAKILRDNSISIRKDTDILVRIINSAGEYSSTLTVRTPDIYYLTRTACAVNDCGTNCTY